MITYLQDRKHYEDRYDDVTIDLCRHREQIYVDAFHKAKKDLKPFTGKDKDKDPERELLKVLNIYYYFGVEWLAGERWEKREEEIQKMMDADEAKDRQLAEARLTSEPVCIHCGKTGLRIISKDLIHRGEHRKYDDPEEVLITLECPACKKRTPVWEDGTLWERLNTYCPKCNAVMKETSSRKDKVITTTYICPACDHTYKDTLGLNRPKPKEEKPDPEYEKDKARFCLSDKAGEEYLGARRNYEALKPVFERIKERSDNKEIYDAIKEIKKPKIAELTPLLAPAFEKAGYIEFSLDKPDMGRDVFIGFSCLDSKSDRDDYASRKALKKLVDETLKDTNWRLMSDGIDYRLGYLSGRLRAYEHEEDLKELVTTKTKGLKRKPAVEKNAYTIRDNNGREIML